MGVVCCHGHIFPSCVTGRLPGVGGSHARPEDLRRCVDDSEWNHYRRVKGCGQGRGLDLCR